MFFKAWQNLDANKNGKISFEEWEIFFAELSKIWKLWARYAKRSGIAAVI